MYDWIYELFRYLESNPFRAELDLSTITLHKLTTKTTVDGEETTELGPALGSKLTLDKAGLEGGSDVVVKVAGAGSPTGETQDFGRGLTCCDQ